MAVNIQHEIIHKHLTLLLDAREYPKTICPSEIARALSTRELQEVGASTWRDLMAPLRERAFQLRDNDTIEILQKGQVLSTEETVATTIGPIRLRKHCKDPA